MVAAVPGIADLANIKGEQISNVGSQDMSFEIMLTLAETHCSRLRKWMALSLRTAPTRWKTTASS